MAVLWNFGGQDSNPDSLHNGETFAAWGQLIRDSGTETRPESQINLQGLTLSSSLGIDFRIWMHAPHRVGFPG